MARVNYKIDIRTLPFIQSVRTLIAVIGTIEKPMYAVFYNKGAVGNSFSLTVESPEDVVCQQWTGPTTVTESTMELIDTYVKIVDRVMLMEEDATADDEDGDVQYYCNNPDCGAKGLITEPMSSELGKMICPFCGEELDEEEIEYENEVDFDRLMEIARMLLDYIEYKCGHTEAQITECYKELESWGIESEEIDYIVETVK